MKFKTLIALAVAGAFAVPFAAQASVDGDNLIVAQAGGSGGSSPSGATSRSGGEALHDRLDKNRDGYVSRDEARDATELQGRFAELDTDNDGKISRSEMRALDSDRTGASTGTTSAAKPEKSSSGSTGAK